MRTIDTCRGCPDRKRIVTETEIFDCHSTCERYKAAVEDAKELHKKIIDASRGDKEIMRYMVDDKEKRRRLNYKCKN